VKINKVGLQYFVNISIFSKKIKCLVDTGSQLNLLPKSCVPENVHIFPPDLSASNYGGGSVEILGYVNEKFYIGAELWGESRFYIVPDHYEPILGSEAIKSNEITVVLHRNKLIKSGPIERLAKLCATKIDNIRIDGIKEDSFFAISEQNYTFRGKSEQMIDLRVDNLKDARNLFVDETQLGNSKLEIIQSFKSVDPSFPYFQVLVVNPLNSSIKIPAGTVFAKLSEIVQVANLKSVERDISKIFNRITVGHISPNLIDKFKNMIKEFSFLFQDDDDLLPETALEKFSIDIGDNRPVSSAMYRTPLALREEMKRILDSFIDQGIIEQTRSEFNSPCLLVRKKNGSFRLVVDYRKLNQITTQQHHPIQQIEDVICYLEGSSIYSSIDLKKGFHQCSVEESSRPALAFSNEWGQYTWRKMPMGCKNAPLHFAKCIDHILRDVPKTKICAYLDDLIVHSKSEVEHFDNLQKFFIVLSQNNLRINIDKARFFERKTTVLGFEISEGHVKPSEDKIESVRKLNIPRNREEAQSLFGLLSQHRKFIPSFAELGIDISRTYRGNFLWTEKASISLEKLKKIICESTLSLKIPQINEAVFVLETDASKDSYGGVLYLCIEKNRSHEHSLNCLRPCAYHSLNFTPSQIKYCTLEKELYAGRSCMERWKTYLAFVNFVWITDNSCVKFANSFKTSNWKIQRWLSEIMGYSFTIVQRKSRQMKISDCLSRNLTCINQIKFSRTSFIDFQKNDQVLKQIRNYVSLDRWPNNTPREIIQYYLNRNSLEILETDELVLNCPSGLKKICVPESLKNEIIKEYHDYSHPGIEICQDKISKKYFWPGMRKNISEFIQSCHYCQSSKPNNHPNRASLGKFRTPEGPYETLSIDLIGPLKETNMGNRYIFSAIDSFSKKVYAEPIYQKQADYLLQIFRGLLFRNPKFPKYVVLDNAPEFRGIAKFLEENKIEPHFIPPRHPQSNGLIENANRTIKARLRARTNLINWDEYLHEIIHDINSSTHSVIKFSPFSVETGILDNHNFHDSNWRKYGNKVDIDFQEIREKIEIEKNKRVEKFHNAKFKEYSLGDLVLIKNFRTSFPPFIGPFKIIYKSPTGSWYNCKNENKEFRRHADNLKPYTERIEIPLDGEIKKQAKKSMKANARKTAEFNESHSSDSDFFVNITDFEDNNDSEESSENSNNDNYKNFISTDSSSSENTSVSSSEDSELQKLQARSRELLIQNRQINEEFNNLPKPDLVLNYLNTSEQFADSEPSNQPDFNESVEYFEDNNLELESIIRNDALSPLPPVESNLISYDKLTDSVLGNDRKRERSDDSLISRKVAKFTHDNNLLNMAILIKMEYEDQSFFEKLDDRWKNDEIENKQIEQGIFLSLRELTKDLLLFILFKLNEQYCIDENVTILRKRIKLKIDKDYPNWRRSQSGKLLFYATFRTQKERSLYDLSLPELKVVCAHYNLPTPQKFTKTFLTAFIEQELPKISHNHPTRKNEIIFIPDVSETEI